MNAVVIEHVSITELPVAWREKLHAASATRVTVRIEEEDNQAVTTLADNPLFGLWHGREDLQDPTAYVSKLRQPRFLPTTGSTEAEVC